MFFFQTPSSVADWLVISKDFEEKWNYPSCIGAIDGKHIAIQNPNDSGSEFYNYKHFYSVLLLAVVDAKYRFIYVEAGAAGPAGDAGLFNASVLKRTLDNGSLNLPPPTCVEGIPEPLISYHMVGNDAFALTSTMMKPYPHRHIDKTKRIFNYRLSRARRVVENAFGILASRFCVFLTTIKLSPERVTYLILASCCLHNFMVNNNKHAYTSTGDVESEDHAFLSGAWRADPPLNSLQSCTTNRNPTRSAKQQRQLLTNYFSGAGAVTWQDNMI
ncbi:putative nuclease HARBI1 [Dendronephthya gigantea]|uniref:putative nuclease HARBI1 n=1 Tax=Dendronephthya gigantea TaxID=151771 RepID=UPI001069D586|nr:putative nuclease HARBI1 [Dendronephthya gigantea]